MKGRPIALEEFERMLAKVPSIVGKEAADSWRYLLWGLWESALRLDELLHVHWTDERSIVPKWNRGSLPVLAIPAPRQKNDVEESIPLLPGFDELLRQTPDADRFGWAFNPMSLQTRLGRRVRHKRPSAEWVSKIVSRIGKAARIVVRGGTGEEAAKFASAHDLRRSCAERLVSAGIPERDVARVLRHASVDTTRKYYAAGSTQQSAGVIREKLSVPRYIEEVQTT
jgi:integrase